MMFGRPSATDPTRRLPAVALSLGLVCVAPLLPGASLLSAQQVVRPAGPAVEGRIIDGRTGEPVVDAWIRLTTEDGQRELAAGSSEQDGRFLLPLHPSLAAEEEPVVVEAGALGYGVTVSEPFDLDPDSAVTVPDLELDRAPLMMDTLRVERERQQFEIPPRERVRERQRRGRGSFLAGAVMSNLEERELDWKLANHIDGLWMHPLRGLQSERSPQGCMVFLINQWPSSRGAILSLDVSRIGAVEVYPEFDDVPEELQFHVMNSGSTSCGLMNVWLWADWNRGVEAGGH